MVKKTEIRLSLSDLKQVIEDLIKEKGRTDNEYSLTIVREFNGYVLKGKSNSDERIPMTILIEDNENDALESHEMLLWEVMEYFGFGGSKHDKERLKVQREKRK